MSVLDKVRVVIYRFHEKGLEILLINDDLSNDSEVWRFPEGQSKKTILDQLINEDQYIELDPIENEKGELFQGFAVEGDWHDIPSIRGIIKHDVKMVKTKIKELVPGVDQSSYFAVKEAFKKVLPHEYAMLKELKDVLSARNLLRGI
jgi:predicted NUDIX family NTP pyrophosphohydrolase